MGRAPVHVAVGMLVVSAVAAAGCGSRSGQHGERSESVHAQHRKEPVPPPEKPTTRPRPRQPSAPKAVEDLKGLDALGSSLGAEIGAVVRAPGGPGKYIIGGTLRSGAAWSTIKVPIVLRLLQDVGGPAGLTERQREDISSAIAASDNDAAARLFADVSQTHGGATGAATAVTQVLKSAGDQQTSVSTEGRDGFSSYGQTDWPLAAQSQFMAALVGGCVGDRASRSLIRNSMANVTSDRWGLGSVPAPAIWKGGWGPGVDGAYLLRQMGAIEIGGRQLVVAFAVRPRDGSFDTGEGVATEVAQWLVRNASDFRLRARPC